MIYYCKAICIVSTFFYVVFGGIPPNSHQSVDAMIVNYNECVKAYYMWYQEDM